VIVDRDAEGSDLALGLERLDRLAPVALLDPAVVPDVELLDVDRLQPEVAKAALGAAPDPLAREGVLRGGVVRRGPALVLGWHLRRHVDPLVVLAHDLSHELLAVSGAVGQGRVDEVHAQVDRQVQGAKRLVVLRPDPHRLPDPPGAVPQFRDLEARSAQPSIAHGPHLPGVPHD
jgi:hypothetical protein